MEYDNEKFVTSVSSNSKSDKNIKINKSQKYESVITRN